MLNAIGSLLVIWVVAAESRGAAAAETPLLVARLRDAANGLAGQPTGLLADFDLWRFGFKENGGVLAEIGLAQLGLGDLQGAEKTARALPVKDKCLNCDDSYRFFLHDLCIALVRAGRNDAAYDVLKSHYVQRGVSYADRLEIARAQAGMGDLKAAKRTCQDAIGAIIATKDQVDCCGAKDPFGLPWGLADVAFAQLSIGDPSAARKTRERIQVVLRALERKNHMRAAIMARMAVIDTRVGNAAAGRRDLEAAAEAVDQQSPSELDRSHREWDWLCFANARCRLGDAQGALREASKVKDGRSEDAYAAVAIYQWRHGDFDASMTTLLAGPGGDIRDQMFIEIAKSQADRRRDYQKALACVAQIANQLRRAQATLEVAATTAADGKRNEAREMARNLDYPRVKLFGDGTHIQFKFDDPKTWNAPYELPMAFTMSSIARGEQMEGDLLAAAVRCRVSLDGKGAIPFLREMNESGWDVRKAAEAQASAGDAAGTFVWADKLSPKRRLVALIGAAEGHAAYLARLHRKEPERPRLGRRHSLMPYVGWFDHLFGDD